MSQQVDVNPYEAPSASVDDEQLALHDSFGQRQLASRSSRLAAAIIDPLVIALPAGMMGGLAEAMSMNGIGVVLMAFAVLAFLAALGLNLYWLADNGQTIGKRMMGIKIVRSDRRSKASLGRILLARGLPRSIVGAIPLIGSVLQLIDVLFIFGDDRRCVHDYIADTSVIVAGGSKMSTDVVNSQAGQPGATNEQRPSEVNW